MSIPYHHALAFVVRYSMRAPRLRDGDETFCSRPIIAKAISSALNALYRYFPGPMLDRSTIAMVYKAPHTIRRQAGKRQRQCRDFAVTGSRLGRRSMSATI